MKSKTLILAVFMALLALTGCIPGVFTQTVYGSGTVVSENRPVSGFSQVSLDGQGDVTVSIGEQESLVIEAEDNLMQYLHPKVTGSELTLNTTQSINLHPTKPIKYLVVVKSLDSLTINGSGNITASQVQAGTFSMKIQGSGTIQMGKLSATQINAQIPGSGTIKVDGQGDSQMVSITGSGNYQAQDLKTQSANVTIAGSGSASIWAMDNLMATISGSGSISYYGTPQVTKSITGSGSITQLGEHS
jgi:hypothetical protein